MCLNKTVLKRHGRGSHQKTHYRISYVGFPTQESIGIEYRKARKGLQDAALSKGRLGPLESASLLLVPLPVEG